MQKIMITVLTLFLVTGCRDFIEKEQVNTHLITLENLKEIPPLPAYDLYGFEKNRYLIEELTVKRNQTLHQILSGFDVSDLVIYKIQKKAARHADLRKLIPGQKILVYFMDDQAAGLIWHYSQVDFLTVKWNTDIVAETGSLPLQPVEQSFSGVIESSLYETIRDGGANRGLGQAIADIYAWEIDFFSLRKGDSFKVIYDELYAGNEIYRTGRVKAAEFVHRGEVYKAYYFDNGERSGWFDEEGNSMQKALLKAPFKYSQRVSSGFSRNRLHPILNQRRPHYGVDYAAHPGTPVLAVGDGIVIEAQYRGGNGNIAQIRHNSTYKTAYLHLQNFAKGIRPGVQVKQGQVIGYVGSTGLATGPHLCYRLYKDNQPVNSLRLELPSSDALEGHYVAEFNRQKRVLDDKLNQIREYDKLAMQ